MDTASVTAVCGVPGSRGGGFVRRAQACVPALVGSGPRAGPASCACCRCQLGTGCGRWMRDLSRVGPAGNPGPTPEREPQPQLPAETLWAGAAPRLGWGFRKWSESGHRAGSPPLGAPPGAHKPASEDGRPGATAVTWATWLYTWGHLALHLGPSADAQLPWGHMALQLG